MAQQPDLPGPTTSYSDPFYDRLEAIAQRVAKRLWILLLALVVVIIVAVVTHAAMRNTPIAASASQFLTAATARMEADQSREPSMRLAKLAEASKSFAAVAADESVTPYYRARAYIELTQLDLDRSALTEAKASIDKARAWAAKATDPDLDLAVGLSEAAVLLQSGDLAGAESRYLSVERAAGSTYPDRQIAATLGAAHTMVAQSHVDEAIAKLETLVNRSDSNAAMLLNLAKNEYWSLKRGQSAVSPVGTPPAAPVTPAPAEQPTATPAPPAAVATPVAPAATLPVAPTVPATPATAPSPEGNK